MKIIKRPVRQFEVRAYCDCGWALQATGGVLDMNPLLYVHVCDKCGKEETLDKLYPYLMSEVEPAGGLRMVRMSPEQAQKHNAEITAALGFADGGNGAVMDSGSASDV